MPTYVYRREDGTTFEIEQPITAAALESCPTTGQPVRRVISGNAGLIFKGDGFYLTDYARKGKGGESKKSDEPAPAASDKDSGGTSAAKADVSAATKD